jgi:PAS domain S-box-containing protein
MLSHFPRFFGPGPGSPAAERVALVQQLATFRQHLLTIGAVQLAIGAMTAIAFAGQADARLLAVWLLLVGGPGVRCLVSWYRRRGKAPQPEPNRRGLDRAVYSALTMGAVWGSTGFLFEPHAFSFSFFIALVVCGLIAGATVALATVPLVWAAFSVPAVGIMTLDFFVSGEMLEQVVGVAALVFLAALFAMARVGYSGGLAAIESGLRHAALAAAVDAARAQLDDAIETGPDGFILWDADDRLVRCNSRFRELYPLVADLFVPGTTFTDLMAQIAARGAAPTMVDGRDWIGDRLERHRNPSGFFDQILPDGRWVRVSERRTKDGGVVTIYTDITDRVRIEQELRARSESLIESEQRYRGLVDVAPDAILISSDGKIAFANARAAALLGYDDAAQLVGVAVLDIVHPDWRGAVADRQADVVESGATPKPLEQKLLRRDGSIVDVEVGGSRVSWHGKRAVQSIVRDITDRKRFERALRQSEERYRTLVETAPDPILINHRGTIVFVNEAMRRLLRVQSNAEIVGSRADALVHPVSRTLTEASTKAIMRGGPPQTIEFKMICRDGSVIEVEASGAPVAWEGAPAMQVIMRDITARKQTEDALRLTQFAVDNAADAVFWIKPDGRFAFVNRAACRLSGYGHVEYKTLSVFDLDPELDRTEWRRLVDQARRSPAAPVIERRLRTKQGLLIPIEIVLNSFEFAGDSYVFAFARDIAVRKAAEERARRHEADLAQVLRTTTVGEMASALSQQLEAPLNSLTEFTQASLARLRSGEGGEGALAEELERATAAAAQAAGVVRGIGSFVKRSEPTKIVADVNALVRSAVNLALSELDANRVNYRLDLAEDLPRVPLDAIAIEQVVLNIVRNAIDSMSDAPAHERRLKVWTALASEEEVEIGVADSGQGFSFEALAKMFDPFFSTKVERMGMGLTIARSIVEAHRGRLWAEQNPDRGATFRMVLPMVAR